MWKGASNLILLLCFFFAMWNIRRDWNDGKNRKTSKPRKQTLILMACSLKCLLLLLLFPFQMPRRFSSRLLTFFRYPFSNAMKCVPVLCYAVISCVLFALQMIPQLIYCCVSSPVYSHGLSINFIFVWIVFCFCRSLLGFLSISQSNAQTHLQFSVLYNNNIWEEGRDGAHSSVRQGEKNRKLWYQEKNARTFAQDCCNCNSTGNHDLRYRTRHRTLYTHKN